MSLADEAARSLRALKEEAKVLKGEKGKNKTYSSSKEFKDELSAKMEFQKSKEKLFDVNGWSHIPGIANAGFELYSGEGKPLSRLRVQKGDFIKIDLAGPVPLYWVRVTDLQEEENKAEFTVQPTYDPTEADDKTVTDHFFHDQARSIFRVERIGRQITGMEIGLNEAINNQDAQAGEKGLINTLVSEGGWALFQEHQWKNLTDYLVGNF
jgi:hypothetical protein